MKKTNKEKNTAHDARMQERVRPKPVDFNWKPLEEVVRKWVKQNEQTWILQQTAGGIWSQLKRA
jgi:hypothetical protein